MLKKRKENIIHHNLMTYVVIILVNNHLYRPSAFFSLLTIVHVTIMAKVMVEKLGLEIPHSNFKETHQNGPPKSKPISLENRNPKPKSTNKREKNSSSSSTTSFICLRSDNITQHHHPHQPTVTVPISPWLISPH